MKTWGFSQKNTSKFRGGPPGGGKRAPKSGKTRNSEIWVAVRTLTVFPPIYIVFKMPPTVYASVHTFATPRPSVEPSSWRFDDGKSWNRIPCLRWRTLNAECRRRSAWEARGILLVRGYWSRIGPRNRPVSVGTEYKLRQTWGFGGLIPWLRRLKRFSWGYRIGGVTARYCLAEGPVRTPKTAIFGNIPKEAETEVTGR